MNSLTHEYRPTNTKVRILTQPFTSNGVEWVVTESGDGDIEVARKSDVHELPPVPASPPVPRLVAVYITAHGHDYLQTVEGGISLKESIIAHPQSDPDFSRFTREGETRSVLMFDPANPSLDIHEELSKANIHVGRGMHGFYVHRQHANTSYLAPNGKWETCCPQFHAKHSDAFYAACVALLSASRAAASLEGE